MSLKQYLTEFIQQDANTPILPHRPLLNSLQAGWESVYLEHQRQPAYETPELSYPIYTVCIHLGAPVTVDSWSSCTPLQRRTMTTGTINVYPANVHCWERTEQATEAIDLHLDPDLFTDAAKAFGDRPLDVIPQFAVRDPLAQHIGIELYTSLQTQADSFYAESMANALAVHLVQRYSARKVVLPELEGGLASHQLRAAIDYIEAHLHQPLQVKAIAQLIQLSPYHFSRLFKQSTGFSPYQYIVQRRVERAKKLLQQGNLAIAEITYEVGFSSQSQLTRHFRKQLGVTPKAIWRSS